MYLQKKVATPPPMVVCEGEYRYCHKAFRKIAERDDTVFDVVKLGPKFRIRSVFVVGRKKRGGPSGAVLPFTHYYLWTMRRNLSFDDLAIM